jgi:hypothetical protein
MWIRVIVELFLGDDDVQNVERSFVSLLPWLLILQGCNFAHAMLKTEALG